MSKVIQGMLIFEKKLVETKFNYRDTVEVYDCHPRPKGSRKRFNPDNKAPVEIVKKYLQPKERKRLLEGSKQTTFKELLQILSTNFSLKALPIDYSNIPHNWKSIEECFMKTISIRIKYEVLEITARAYRDVKLEKESFPKDDVVAVFRIHNPIRYQFILRYEWNDKCCPREPMRTYPRDHDGLPSDEFPSLKAVLLPEGWLEIEKTHLELEILKEDEVGSCREKSSDPHSGK